MTCPNGAQPEMETTGDKTEQRDDAPGSTERRGVGVQVRRLRKGYNGHEALKGIDFEVKPGEMFVIMGLPRPREPFVPRVPPLP